MEEYEVESLHFSVVNHFNAHLFDVAAISMTLCELATAKHYSPPLECFPFASQPYDVDLDDEDSQASCVECVRVFSLHIRIKFDPGVIVHYLEVPNFGPAILVIFEKSVS